MNNEENKDKDEVLSGMEPYTTGFKSLDLTNFGLEENKDKDDVELDYEIVEESVENEDSTEEDTEQTKSDSVKEDTEEEPEEDKNDSDKEVQRKSRSRERINALLETTSEQEKITKQLIERLQEQEEKISKLTAKEKKAVKQGVDAEQKRISEQITVLKNAMRQALENHDTEKVVEIQDKLSDLKVDQRVIKAQMAKMESTRKTTPQQEEEALSRSEKGDESVEDNIPEEGHNWVNAHPKFFTDPKFHKLTLIEVSSLEKEGADPESREFYKELTSRLSDMFDEGEYLNNEYLDKDTGGEETEVEPETETKPKQKQPPTGSSSQQAGRDTVENRNKKVKISREDFEAARKFGMSPKKYVEQKKNLGNSFGGFTKIKV